MNNSLSSAAQIQVEEQRRGLQYLFKLDKAHSANKRTAEAEKQAAGLLHRVAFINENKIG